MPQIIDPNEIMELVRETEVIAVVGISKNPERTSFRIADKIREKGYTMYYVNPTYAGEMILGEKVKASLKKIPEHVDIVDVFRNPEHIEPILEEAVAIGADTVWLQPGSENQEVIDAFKKTIDIVSDACLGVVVGQLLD